MNDHDLGDAAEVLRALLAMALEKPEQRAHRARPPQHKPARYYIRRNAHRTLARFAPHAHNRCS
jgi:hypothetical protein